jgi:hypothetical protein
MGFPRSKGLACCSTVAKYEFISMCMMILEKPLNPPRADDD